MNPELEILEFNYWEHFKYARDLALIYPPDHPRMVALTKLINTMITRINEIKKEFLENY